MSIEKKTLSELETYTEIKVYENDQNEVTATMVQDLVKTVSKTTIPSNNLNPGNITWEPTQHLLFPTDFTGEGATIENIPTIEVSVGCMIQVKISNKIYQYELQSSTKTTDSPNYIQPYDYAEGSNQKCWVLIGERYKTITAADLTNGVYTYEHGLSLEGFMIQLKDNNGIFQPVSQQIKATDTDTIEIDFGGAIEGTWQLFLKL